VTILDQLYFGWTGLRIMSNSNAYAQSKQNLKERADKTQGAAMHKQQEKEQ